jgi:hypothetical protein
MIVRSGLGFHKTLISSYDTNPRFPPTTASFYEMNEQSGVADFYRRELARALNEQSFGITRSEITHFSENEAEATITLLEGQIVDVALSSAGYKVGQILSNDRVSGIYCLF